MHTEETFLLLKRHILPFTYYFSYFYSILFIFIIYYIFEDRSIPNGSVRRVCGREWAMRAGAARKEGKGAEAERIDRGRKEKRGRAAVGVTIKM